ncbi:M1 family metallopeptidase [Halomonas chromatireducens]|uniref:Aminopeptidase N n=1 Tax=Halomonas chromatireducens TaxID=507626 RepID=A0A120JWV8_9GAMM|nr:M1 family aminopeptidase [Halomonas chromatireducens]AMD02597.1 Aminopeptidase N [Halomonas chromatireducens]
MLGCAWRVVTALLLVLSLALPAHGSESAQSEGASESEREVQMSVLLEPSSQRIQGEMIVRPPPLTGTFRLDPGLEISEALVDDRALFLQESAAGRYRLAMPPKAESLTLRWSGRLEAEDGRMVSPEGSLLAGDGGWYPQFAELGPFALHIEVQVPDGQRAVATGSLVEEPLVDDTGYRVRHFHPRTEWAELATGPWRERRQAVDGVRVRTLFPAELDDAHAETYLAHSGRYLAQFSERVGGYPYDSFTIAASPAPLGLAFPGFTLLGERVIPLPFIPHTSLAHELMHAWWGAGVRVDYPSGNWSEALTTYLADYHLDELRGEASDTRRRWLVDLAALPDTFDRPLADFRGSRDPAMRLLGYQHGAMLFHMLRQRIGDEAFDGGLKRFAARHMHQTASWDDLAVAFSEAADEELRDFLGAWRYKPGRPALSMTAVERRETETGWQVEGVLDQAGDHAPWPLLVPVVAETRSGPVRHDVALATRQAKFSLSYDAEPLSLTVDPDHDLLRQLDPAPFILRHVALHPESRLLVLPKALEAQGKEWVQQALGRPLAPVGEPALDGEAPLLVLGNDDEVANWLAGQALPEPSALLPALGEARMWTLPESRVAVVSAAEPDHLRRLVASLRHHQHRSYLVQDAEGATLEAGVWPLDEVGLRVEFSSSR